MATALDLLMSTKEDVNLLSEESDICTIDAKTRIIFVPSTIVVGGVQSDKNAERIKFSCPKIVGDNLDLSKFSVRINFENVSSVDFNVSIKDQYICDDVAVDGENVTFSWLIGRNAARYMGTVRFIVCAVKTDSDSNISVEWNTAIAEVPVLEGIEIDQPQIGQEEKDVINQLLELTKNTSAEAVQNVNSAKEQAIKDIQSVSQPDTTLTIEGGLAEAKATGEAIGSLKEDLTNIVISIASIVQNTNLTFDKTGYVTTAGTINSTSAAQNTGFVSVKGYKNVIFVGNMSSSGYAVAFYDRNKILIENGSSVGNGSGVYDITVPNTAFYMIVSNYGINEKSAVLYANINLIDKVSELEPLIDEVTGKILNVTPLFTEYGFYSTSGKFTQTNNAKNTGFVTLGSCTTITAYTSISSAGLAIAFFDENKNILLDKSIKGNGLGKYQTSVPDNARYAVICAYNYPNASARIFSETSIETRIEFLETKHYNTFSVIGDSYSSYEGYMADTNAATWYPNSANDVTDVTNTWWYKFANSYDSRLIENDSWSGSTISYDGYGTGTDDGKENSFITRRRLIGKPELLLIFGGTNDAWVANDTGRTDFLGEYKYSDFTEADMIYFRPALAYLISQIMKENAGMKIVFVLNSDIGTVSSSITEICTHYGVDVIALNNIEKKSAHPTEKGMTQISQQVVTFMKSLH